jgi:SAM-dependent methyltransferase
VPNGDDAPHGDDAPNGDEEPVTSADEPTAVDITKLAAEIEAEVRARRASGEYPPGFERELDALFARFAPPEVSTDFDAALEKAEDLVQVDPVVPVASNNPVLGVVKKVVSKLIGWYHVWIAQQITAIAVAINNALRLLGKKVADLEHITGDQARARTIGARLPAERDDAVWTTQVVGALRGCAGRIAVVECGRGELLGALDAAGLDAYGVEPHASAADDALSRGLEVRIDAGAAHLESIAPGAVAAIVLRGVVERAALGEVLLLVDSAAVRLAPGGRLIVCSLRREAWGQGFTAAEADLTPGHPLHPDTWAVILPEQGFGDVRVQDAGDTAYVVEATRADT